MELQYNGCGKVLYNDNEYRCVLYLNKKEGGILLKIIVDHEEPFGKYLEIPLEISFIYGQLESGFKFTLINLERNGMKDLVGNHCTEYSYYADYIICGISENNKDEPTFCKVEYTLSNIIEWGEESIFIIDQHYRMSRKLDNANREIYKNKDVNVSYSVDGSFLPFTTEHVLKESIDLKQSGKIIIEFQQEEKLFKFNEVFKRIKSLIEIAKIRKINVEKVVACSNKYLYPISEKSIPRLLDIYGKGIKEEIINETTDLRSWQWLSFTELIENDSFRHYYNKYDKLAPIIELFIEPLYVDGFSFTRIFLNIVQALETYHSRFVTNNMDVFKSRIDHLVKGYPDDQAKEIREFLMANSNKFITLESRLADLLLANHNIYFDTGDIPKYEFPSVVSHTRNYYIHYDEGIKASYRVLSEEELKIYNRSLCAILEYYILLELGFPENDVKMNERLHNRWGNISQELELLKMSQEKQNNGNSDS